MSPNGIPHGTGLFDHLFGNEQGLEEGEASGATPTEPSRVPWHVRMNISRSHIAWAVLVLNEVLCIWLFFSSSSWLVKERVVIPVDLGGDGAATATFTCGPISFCMTDVSPKGAVSAITPTVSFGEFCATGYGKHFLDIPQSTWILGAVCIYIGGLLWACVLASALASLCFHHLAKTVRNVTSFASLLIVIAMVIVGVGIKDAAPDESKQPIDQGLCHMCSGAGSFERGACSLGWGAAGAIIFSVMQVPVVMLGYYVPHTYDRSGKVYPSVNIASTAAR